MILFLLIAALSLLGLVAMFFLALTAFGYYNRAKQATIAANKNAGHWAEAEARANIAETELGRVSVAFEAFKTCYADMKGIAERAVDAAKEKQFSPKPVDHADSFSNLSNSLGRFNESADRASRTPNFITVDCRNCSAPVGRVREEFPVRCGNCGEMVDPVLDAKELSE